MMIRSVAVLACLITAAVMGYFIRDINRRFPNPSVCEQYTKDSPAMLDGLEMYSLFLRQIYQHLIRYTSRSRVLSDIMNTFSYLLNRPE